MKTIYTIPRRPEDLFYSKSEAPGKGKAKIMDGRASGGLFAIYWATPRPMITQTLGEHCKSFRIIKREDRYWLGADRESGNITWICEIN